MGALVFGGIRVIANVRAGRPAQEGVLGDMLLGGLAGATLGAAAPEATATFTARLAGIGLAAATTAPALVKLPVPETPGGMSAAEFGQTVMRWGRGSAAAIARIGEITRDELTSAGVTREMAQRWAAFYANEAARVADNPSAAGRAELMKHAADLLK